MVVTAQRRSENLQDVPITVQAISGEQLTQLNVVSFNDLMKYTPNVTFSGNGPGTGNIFMRGLGTRRFRQPVAVDHGAVPERGAVPG